jgi:hypothetical protein
LYFYGVQDWPGAMNFECCGIAKPFMLCENALPAKTLHI